MTKAMVLSGILEARNPEIWEFGNLGISRSTL